MKAKTLLLAATIAASTMLGSCDSIKHMIGGKPKGQVVATVNGDEITALDLRGEMGGFNSRDPKVIKTAQQQALQQIIMRTLMVQQAKARKLDKTADYALQVRRGEQSLLAQLLQQKIAGDVPAPSSADVAAFVASHPDNFANRRVLVVDQVIAAPNKIDPERFKPINTLDEVKALLQSENVPFQENVATIDTLTADPRLVSEIDKLPPQEIFVIPQRNVFVFNHLNQTRPAPFIGAQATNYAAGALRQQRVQQEMGKQMEALRRGADAQIVYNPAYKPTPPAKPATPPAKAPS